MELRSGKYDGVDIANVPTAELKQILGQSTNAGNPFTAREIDAVQKELAAREEAEKTAKAKAKAEEGRAENVEEQKAEEAVKPPEPEPDSKHKKPSRR